MLGSLRSWVAGLLGRERSAEDVEDPAVADEDGEPSDSGGFLPSRLDASVLFAHGKGGTVETTDEATVEELASAADERERRRED
jgi:hypothetical protein